MHNSSTNLFQNPLNSAIHSSGFVQKANIDEKILFSQSVLSKTFNNEAIPFNSIPINNCFKHPYLEKSCSVSSMLNHNHFVAFQRSNSLQDYHNESKGEQKGNAKQLLNFEESIQSKSKSIFEDLIHLWSGFLTSKKKNRVGVDAYLIKGNISESILDYNLNISQKIDLTFFNNNNVDVSGILIFSPSNETQHDIFNIYLSKLQLKQKVLLI